MKLRMRETQIKMKVSAYGNMEVVQFVLINVRFSCCSENIGLLRTKFENGLQDFWLCKTRFAMFIVPCNFDVDRVDEV
jgi:hypothetical protein